MRAYIPPITLTLIGASMSPALSSTQTLSYKLFARIAFPVFQTVGHIRKSGPRPPRLTLSTRLLLISAPCAFPFYPCGALCSHLNPHADHGTCNWLNLPLLQKRQWDCQLRLRARSQSNLGDGSPGRSSSNSKPFGVHGWMIRIAPGLRRRPPPSTALRRELPRVPYSAITPPPNGAPRLRCRFASTACRRR
jgi:hypothetical protein